MVEKLDYGQIDGSLVTSLTIPNNSTTVYPELRVAEPL